MDIKLITMDMDGTLLGDTPTAIPPENLKALKAAQAKGIQLALASGRCADDLAFSPWTQGFPYTRWAPMPA